MEKVIDSDLILKLKKYKNFGIGLHGIDPSRTNGNGIELTANLIMKEGLKLGSGYGSLNGNVASVGIIGKDDDARISDRLSNYAWAGSVQNNIIVAYPGIIENSRGDKLYLGFTQSPRGYDQDTQCSFMDKACAKLGYVPNEFILGHYTDTERKYGNCKPGEHIVYDYEENPEFCKGTRVSDELFEKMGTALGHDRALSEVSAKAIDTGDITDFVSKISLDLRIAKTFKFDSMIKFLKLVYTDVSQRVIDNLREKGITQETDVNQVGQNLFDDAR